MYSICCDARRRDIKIPDTCDSLPNWQPTDGRLRELFDARVRIVYREHKGYSSKGQMRSLHVFMFYLRA